MMDLLNEPIERITRRVKEGGIELSEIPLTRRKKVEAALTDFSGVVELPDPAAELEADKAEVREEVAAKSKSTKKRSKKSASKES